MNLTGELNRSKREGLFQRVDARLKVICGLGILLALNLPRAPSPAIYAAATFAIGAAVFLSRLPLSSVVWRAAWGLPFAAIAGLFLPFKPADALTSVFFAGRVFTLSRLGCLMYLHLLAKTYLSLATVVVIVASTSFGELTRALTWWRVPSFFVLLLSFTYRFVFVFADEVRRMNLARRARSFGWHRNLWATAGATVAALYGRAYGRAERVWLAMVARGVDAAGREK